MNTQHRYLQVELAKAKAEAAYLRKHLKVSNRHAKRVDRAYEDALLLASWWSAGIIPSRAYAKRFGMTQNCWQNAVALLKMARVIQRQRHWATADLDLIEARLCKARADAMNVPESFFCRLPQHGRQ
jgi:hypothetical protein